MFINDVGSGAGASSQNGQAWEINDGMAGGNYDWPNTEGPFTGRPADRLAPFSAYTHTDFAAITGGAFHNPDTAQFPSATIGDYFYADLGKGFIQRVDLTTRQVMDFATNINQPVDLEVGPEGTLYYLSRGENRVMAIRAQTNTTLVYSDNFNRGDNPFLGSEWNETPNGLALSNQKIANNDGVSTATCSGWRPRTFRFRRRST
jgi:hypothetical protein